MHPVTVLIVAALVLAVLLAVGWYLSYLAARLDRLHHRVETSYASLEAHLARRSAAALQVAQQIDGPVGAELRRAAQATLASPVDEPGENGLTRALHQAFPVAVAMDGPLEADLAELISAQERVQLARRFHNDAVAHAQRMRRKRVVRSARLAGHAKWPTMVEFDDSIPPGLDDAVPA